jgi:adenylate kinase
LKYIIIILVVAVVTYFLTPTKIKEVEKIVYRDKIVNTVEVKTETKYKDGKVVTVSKLEIVEVEKEKTIEKEIQKIIKKERSIYILPAIDLSGYKLIGVGFSNKIFLSFDFFVAMNYNVDEIRKSNIQLGVKYDF